MCSLLNSQSEIHKTSLWQLVWNTNNRPRLPLLPRSLDTGARPKGVIHFIHSMHCPRQKQVSCVTNCQWSSCSPVCNSLIHPVGYFWAFVSVRGIAFISFMPCPYDDRSYSFSLSISIPFSPPIEQIARTLRKSKYLEYCGNVLDCGERNMCSPRWKGW